MTNSQVFVTLEKGLAKVWKASPIIYNLLDDLLASEEGPPTFACKNQDADRQGWYIYYWCCVPDIDEPIDEPEPPSATPSRQKPLPIPPANTNKPNHRPPSTNQKPEPVIKQDIPGVLGANRASIPPALPTWADSPAYQALPSRGDRPTPPTPGEQQGAASAGAAQQGAAASAGGLTIPSRNSELRNRPLPPPPPVGELVCKTYYIFTYLLKYIPVGTGHVFNVGFQHCLNLIIWFVYLFKLFTLFKHYLLIYTFLSIMFK